VCLPEVFTEAVRAFILQVVEASIAANDIGVSPCPIRLVTKGRRALAAQGVN
jgi:hypothetical protein